jgi:hypothetical protein
VLALSGVQLNPTSTTGGSSSSQNQVVLTGPAPAGGASVALSSSNPAVASLPQASVLVPSGATSTTFTIATTAVSSATPVAISAFYSGVTKSATLTVNPPAAPAAYTLQAASTGTRGSTVQVNWTAPAGHSSNDTIRLYRSNGAYSAQKTGPGTSGSVAMRLPNQAGEYTFRYAKADGTIMASSPITVR